MNDLVIVQCAVTGAQDANGKNPNLPRTPEEIGAAAVEAARAGAAVVHIHARDDSGEPTLDRAYYKRIVDRIREHDSDVVINISTGSGNGRASGAARYACLDLGAEMASFDCGSLNFGERIFENPLPFLRDLAGAIREHNVKPEIECFEAGHITTALRLRGEGLLSDPLHFQFVLGVPGGAPGTVEQATFMRSMIPPEATWSICGIGAAQLSLNLYSLAAGAHVRTGMEDNLYYSRGRLANSNSELVERVVRLVNEAGRTVATPDQARELLALPVAVTA